MKKLNICLLNDSFPPVIDGVANAVLNYAAHIQKSLGNALVVTPDYPGAKDDYAFPVIRYQSFNTEKLVGYRTGNPLSSGLLKKIGEHDIDIIHTHCPLISGYIARMLRETTSAPIILTYHTKYDIDIANNVKMKGLQETAIKWLMANICACDDVWVVSKGAGENLRGLGFDGEYTVMENGVDFAKGMAPQDEIKNISREYGLMEEDVRVFMFAGRMMWYKGLRLIIDALSRIKSQGCRFKMVFVGSGVEEDEIKKYAKRCGIFSDCVFTGAIGDREKLRAFYSRADLFLFPSTFDTNGIVVREAAACALASVLIEGSCAAEGVTDQKNGYLIKEDAVFLAKILKFACENTDAVRRVGERAMSDLYLSWEESIDRAYERYLYIYEKYTGMRRHSAVKREHLARTAVELIESFERE